MRTYPLRYAPLSRLDVIFFSPKQLNSSVHGGSKCHHSLAGFCLLALCLSINPLLFAQSKTNPVDKFRQLEELLPTPNEQRSASGAPGPKYWQQRADYKIAVELDDAKQRIIGSETITYFNNSPGPA